VKPCKPLIDSTVSDRAIFLPTSDGRGEENTGTGPAPLASEVLRVSLNGW